MIHGAHGLKGALTIFSYTRPAIGIAGYSRWWLGESAEVAKPYHVQRCWQHGRRILAQLDGIADMDTADALKGFKIRVHADDVEVNREEFLWEDLLGCEVIVAGGETLGTVTALEEYGAQDILVVRTPADAARCGEWMLPFIREVVVDVDLTARRIEVNLTEGMDACFTPKS